MPNSRKRNNIHNNIYVFLTITVVVIITLLLGTNKLIYKKDNNELTKMYLASNTNNVSVFKIENQQTDNKNQYSKMLVEAAKIPRGTKIQTTKNVITYENKKYILSKIENKHYYINETNLVNDLKEVVLENKIYVRTATSILNLNGSNQIIDLASKGEELEVIGFNKINSSGEVDIYTIQKQEKKGLVYGKYMSYTKEESLENYMSETYDQIHSKIKNLYGGGNAIELDFYPNEKVTLKNNIMPDSVYALYLNSSQDVINNIDSYIEFAKNTKINAFVVDIKDNERPAYPAETFKQLSPTNYKYAINSYELYKNAITKLKTEGFYIIGRITVFKDNYYVQDHPETAILNKETNQPYVHNGSYWPSPYNRDVWYFNVTLAKEAVETLGFNEINFDYVRFPDRMNKVSNIIELNNQYNESKVQAIQRFVQYAKNTLHEINAYISIDVFGETTNGTYTTAYGQYWPAISNEADVICGMPYPDHFSKNSYGIPKPWTEPYKLMNYWARYANERQKEIPTPAKVRTWIQAYDVMKHVDSSGIKYGAKEVEQQIRGLYEAGIMDGYITWLSDSNLTKYQSQAVAFNIDYRKEYNKNG